MSGMAWEGYDPSFLRVEVALPRPIDDRDVHVLAYARFSVLLDPVRRFAVATGVNIDGSTLHDLERRGDWRLDDRVDAAEQAGPGVYADNDLDRGHLVRRRDPGWGTVDEAREAMAATFFYPNAAPQASVFNQSKDLWVGLEDHVLHYADAEDLRVSVFTAPVLADGDPPYRGILIPRRFWKVAAWSSAEAGEPPTLAAAGFVLDQSQLIDRSTLAPLGAFRTFQVPLAEIAELAGVDLGPLVDADVLQTTTARAAAWVPLNAPSDVVLS
jgi:endonuclease G, mitochondrial